MTDESRNQRRAELIAAAVADELAPADQRELAVLRATDPSIDDEIIAVRAITERISGIGSWTEAAPSDLLRARIAGIERDAADVQEKITPAAPTAERAVRSPVPLRQDRRRRVVWLAPTAAAAGVVLGLGLGLGIPAVLDRPPQGPPGTLGAIEHVEVGVTPPSVAIDADLVAHTWGTEAVIEATGLEVGSTYTVVITGLDGQEYSAGEMIGSEVPIFCRLNAAVLREDVASIEIRDARGGLVVHAEVPRA